MKLDPTTAKWLCAPSTSTVHQNLIELTTESETDLWQNTYYGFQIANAPALMWEEASNFTFSVRALFSYRRQFDQCGILLYLDEKNWFKASIEHEEKSKVRLGSVVTNHGYSDWATTDIDPVEQIYYRLSRRGPDFLAEHSMDGERYYQMRVFHMTSLGETSVEMSKADPPIDPYTDVKYGVYACSPGDSSFIAQFDQPNRHDCTWKPHPQ